jgi:hypothetical protein
MLTPQTQPQVQTATPSRKTAPPRSRIRRLDMNSTLEVMSFLDPSDLAQFGAASHEYLTLSHHPSIWRNIKINNVYSLNVSGLAQLISHTTSKMPLNTIDLSGPVTTGCYCRESNMCKGCSEVGRCSAAATCPTCEPLGLIKPKLGKLKSFTVHNAKFLSACPFNTMLQSCHNLKKLDILNDLDVNLVISALAANCPSLTDIRFKYSHGLDFEASFRQSHPLLRPQVAEVFVSSCPNVHYISFCHYTVDEDCARSLLELRHVLEADFSDNENLSGAFLVRLPMQWANLKKLTMRDCTELDNDYVQMFASMIGQSYGGMLKYCHSLEVADFSCQWAFHGDSLIGDGSRLALRNTRARSFTWREDQCEIPGFGIDPDSGIDGIDDPDDLYYDILGNSSVPFDGEVPSEALDEALAHLSHDVNIQPAIS